MGDCLIHIQLTGAPRKSLELEKLYVDFHLFDAAKDDVMSYLSFSRTINVLFYAFYWYP